MASKINEGISSDNPLREMPYWGCSEGKNLTLFDALEWSIAFVQQMNKEVPCIENDSTIWHLKEAIKYQQHRIQLRKEQGVYGTNKPHVWKTWELPLDDIG